MTTMHTYAGAGVGGFRFAGWVLGAALALGTVAQAQDPAPSGSEAPGTEAPDAGSPVAEAPDSESVGALEAAAEPRFARVAAGTVPLRAFQTDQSPTYEEELVEGDVVQIVGPLDRGYWPVTLPLGIAGFVHADHVDVDEAGTVTAKVGIMFRSSARTDEGMVGLVPAGHAFRLLEERAPWLLVRDPGRQAWIAEDAVTLLEASVVEASWRDLAARQESALREVVEARVAAREHAAKLEDFATRADALQTRIAATRAESADAAGWEPVVAAASTFRDEAHEAFDLSEDDAAAAIVARADQLYANAEREHKLQTVAATLSAPVERPESNVEVARPVANPMERFSASGWVRVRDPMLFGEQSVSIERGGRKLFTLECSSGRYDLSIFDDFELGVIGDVSRPDADGVRVIDVRRIEVVNVPNR